MIPEGHQCNPICCVLCPQICLLNNSCRGDSPSNQPLAGMNTPHWGGLQATSCLTSGGIFGTTSQLLGDLAGTVSSISHTEVSRRKRRPPQHMSLRAGGALPRSDPTAPYRSSSCRWSPASRTQADSFGEFKLSNTPAERMADWWGRAMGFHGAYYPQVSLDGHLKHPKSGGRTVGTIGAGVVSVD